MSVESILDNLTRIADHQPFEWFRVIPCVFHHSVRYLPQLLIFFADHTRVLSRKYKMFFLCVYKHMSKIRSSAQTDDAFRGMDKESIFCQIVPFVEGELLPNEKERKIPTLQIGY